MTNERVDELIDRVAAELTAVPCDPAFTDRVRGRMRPVRTPRSVMLVFAAAAATIVLAIAVMQVPQWMRSSATPSAPAARRPEDRTIATAAPTLAQAPAATSNSRARTGVAPRAVEPTGTVPPPLSDFETTAIMPLAIEPLSLPSAVEPDPLAVRVLEITEIGDDSVVKEPK